MTELTLGIALLGWATVVHLAVWRIRLPDNHTRGLLVVFALAPVAGVALLGLLRPGSIATDPAAWLRLALLYVPCALAYIVCYSAIENESATLALAVRLADAGARGATLESLQESFAREGVRHQRLASMVASGLVRMEAGGYALTAKGRILARMFRLVEWVAWLPQGIVTDAWLLTCAPVFGMIANVFLQAALSRVWGRRNPGTAIGCGAISGLAVAGGIAACAPAFPAMERVSWSVLSYLGLAFGYWAFLNLNLTSLRIRVLKEIADAPGGTLPHTTLARRLDDRELVDRRVARLEAAGQVVRMGDRYVLKGHGLVRIARLIRLFRRAIIPVSSPRARVE